MASSAAFKQACPSCGEAVTIRDESLIGKKMRCPLCKFAFQIEAPAAKGKTAKNGKAAPKTTAKAAPKTTTKAPARNGRKAAVADDEDEQEDTPKKGAKGKRRLRDEDDDDGDDEEEDEDSGKKKKKKKGAKKGGGDNNKMLIAVGVAVVGLVVLAVGGFLLMSGGSGPTGGGSVNNANMGMPGPEGMPQNGQDPTKQKPGLLPQGPADLALLTPADDNFTNLLPPESEHVIHIHLKHLLESPLGETAFLPPLGFDDEALKKELGFSLQAVDAILHGESASRGWAFHALHSTRAFEEANLVKALHLEEAAGGPIKGQKYYKIAQRNPFLEEFARLSLTAQRPAEAVGKARQPMYVRLHDPQTLIVADLMPLQEFLQSEGKFKFLSQAAQKTPPPNTNNGQGMNPAGPGTPPMDPMNPMNPVGPGTPPMNPTGSPMMDPTVPPGTAPMPGSTPAPAGTANRPAAAPGQRYMTLNPALKKVLDRVEKDEGSEPAMLLFSSATDLQATAGKSQDPFQKNHLFWRLSRLWNVTSVLDESEPRLKILGVSLHQSDLFRYELKNNLVCSTKAKAEQVEKDLVKKAAPRVEQFFGKALTMDLEVYNPRPKAATGTQPGYGQPGYGPAGYPPAGTPPGYPPMPDTGMVPMQEGMMPPGTYPPGMTPPGMGGQPGQKEEDEPKKSHIRIERKNEDVTFALKFNLEQGELQNLRQLAGLVVAGLRMQVDIVRRANPHDLARAVQQLGEKGLSSREIGPGQFPPGVFPGSSHARDPMQRISWMAGLLPYMGHETLYSGIQFNHSWKDPANWLVARTLVPEFLDPRYPAALRSVNYPGLPLEVGATHYVGIAGIGPDAAEYRADDPAGVGKLGVFGYNRSTRLDTIQKGRGLSSTAVMVQIPQEIPVGMTPWLAGGGSTLRGIPETNSVQPFVGQHGDKRGTYVVMADGSVRFVSENISDAAFKALCTINGPAPTGFVIDSVAPKVDRSTPAAPLPVDSDKPAETVPAKPQPTPTAGWKKYTSKEGRFTVLLPPGSPKVVQLPAPAEVGGTFTLVALEAAGGKQGVGIMFGDLPSGAKDAAPAARIQAVKQAFLDPQGVQIQSERPVTLGSVPGHEFTAQGPRGLMVVRFFLANNRAYMIMIRGENLQPNSQEAQAFLNSFTITPG